MLSATSLNADWPQHNRRLLTAKRRHPRLLSLLAGKSTAWKINVQPATNELPGSADFLKVQRSFATSAPRPGPENYGPPSYSASQGFAKPAPELSDTVQRAKRTSGHF